MLADETKFQAKFRFVDSYGHGCGGFRAQIFRLSIRWLLLHEIWCYISCLEMLRRNAQTGEQTVCRGSRRISNVLSRPPIPAAHNINGRPTRTGRAMETASSTDGDSERHAHLLLLLAAAMQRRRGQKRVRTVAVWRVIMRSYDDDDDEDRINDDAHLWPRTRRVL